MLTYSEAQVVQQFVADNGESKGIVNAFSSEQIQAITDLIEQHQIKPLQNGKDLVLVALSKKGGNIRIHPSVQFDMDEEEMRKYEYGKYVTVTGQEDTILIEHPEYHSKHVEPYNRQGVFYVGLSFRQFDNKTVVDGWNVYKSEYFRQGRSSFAVSKFYHNDFWHIIEFGVLVADSQQFIQKLLEIIGYEPSVVNIVLNG